MPVLGSGKMAGRSSRSDRPFRVIYPKTSLFSLPEFCLEEYKTIFHDRADHNISDRCKELTDASWIDAIRKSDILGVKLASLRRSGD
jgi:hypothetical protein